MKKSSSWVHLYAGQNDDSTAATTLRASDDDDIEMMMIPSSSATTTTQFLRDLWQLIAQGNSLVRGVSKTT
jgi:predicted Zn-dependent protease